MSPAVLETLLESASGPDQELSVDLAESPEVETDLMLCPTNVSNQPQPIPADSDGPDAEPEVEPTDECVNPYPELPEISPEADHPSLYPTGGPDRANSRKDIPRSEDYKYCQLPRYRMDHLPGCSQL